MEAGVSPTRDRRPMHHRTMERIAADALEGAWAALVRVRDSQPSRENSIAITKAQEAVMWAKRDELIKHMGLDPDEPRMDDPQPRGSVVEPSRTVKQPPAPQTGS